MADIINRERPVVLVVEGYFAGYVRPWNFRDKVFPQQNIGGTSMEIM